MTLGKQATADPLATLAPLGIETLHDRAYQRLAEQIMAGAFKPGQTMSMQRLAELLGTSTTPVREALRRLAAEGAVEIRAKRAVRIPRMTRARFSEIGDIRMALEGLAAGYAAERIKPAQLKSLKSLNVRMERCLANDEVARYLELNQAFHFGVYRAGEAPVALSIIESLWLQMGPIQGLYTERSVARGGSFHQDIIAALDRRDAAAATDATRKDVELGIQVLSETSAFED